jgi:outer membrane protein assembly factor BamB
MVDIDAAPVVADNTVFAVNYQGRVAAVSLRSGATMWARDMSSSAGLDVAGGRVFVSDASSHLWGLDGDGGASYWRQESLERRRLTAPVIVGGHVAVGDYEGYLHFFDVTDGAEVARLRVGDGPMLTPPLVVDGTLLSLDANGALAAVRIGN